MTLYRMDRSRKGKVNCQFARFDEIEPFLEEAYTLAGVGQWKDPEKIFKRLFIPSLYLTMQDVDLYQSIAVNYGLCLRLLAHLDCFQGGSSLIGDVQQGNHGRPRNR
jgi:hypothetical protein